jgi:hypothetical protein
MTTTPEKPHSLYTDHPVKVKLKNGDVVVYALHGMFGHPAWHKPAGFNMRTFAIRAGRLFARDFGYACGWLCPPATVFSFGGIPGETKQSWWHVCPASMQDWLDALPLTEN